MTLTTMGIIGVTALGGVSCFLFGAIWGRESALKQLRSSRSFDPDQF